MSKDYLISKLYINQDYSGNAGTLEKLDAKEIQSQLKNKICKIIKENETGTGFFIKIPHPDQFHLLPVLITNNHILDDKDLSINNDINLTINDDKEKRCLKIDKSRKTFTHKKLDVTIIEIKPEEDKIKDFLDLDQDFNSEQYKEIYKKEEELYILQYPNGKSSSFSLGILKEIKDTDIEHKCDTDFGSSGSPILLKRNYKVIGVHKLRSGFNFNKGTLIKFAIEEFNKKYPRQNNHINLNNMIEMVLDNNGNEDIYILNYSKYKIYKNNKIDIKGIILHDNTQTLDNSNVEINFININNNMIYNGMNKLPKGLLNIRIKFKTLLTKCRAMFFKLKLISIDLSSFVTRDVKDMSYMFSDCAVLKTIKINIDTNNVTNMYSMFNNCSKLEYLNLSTFNTRNVKNMSYMFNNCSNLKNLNLASSFNTENAEFMAFMFNNCSSLEYLDLPSSFNTKNVKDMSSMFSECKNISSINLNSFNTQNVESMKSMFCDCQKLKELNLSKFNTKNVKSMRKLFKSCFMLKNLQISSFNTENVEDMSYMFDSCKELENLDISFNSKKVNNMEYMFNLCINLNEINFIQFNTENVKYMNNMFFSCSQLNNLDLSKFNTHNAINMENMFCGCAKIEYLDLSTFDTENVKNMSNMFCTCSNLIGVDLTSFNTKNVENMSCMFMECIKLVSLNISSFDLKKVNNMEFMFKDCRGLEEIYVDKNKNKNLIQSQIGKDNINPNLKSD